MKSSRVRPASGARTDFPSPREIEDTVLFAIRSQESIAEAVTSHLQARNIAVEASEHAVTQKNESDWHSLIRSLGKTSRTWRAEGRGIEGDDIK